MSNEYNYNEMENDITESPNYILQQKVQARIEKKENAKRLRKARMKKFISVTCIAVLFGAVSGAAFTGASYLSSSLLGIEETSTSSTIETTMVTNSSSSDVVSDVATIVENVMPSIVSISNLSVQEVQSYFGGSTVQESESVGSGIIVNQTDTELLILTNYHVIEDSDTITVTFANEDSIEAQLKGGDSAADLAIVSISLDLIPTETLNSIKIATLGDSDDLQVGETVIAIGNALGYGQSVTTGVVSAVDRTLEGIDSELIQTDAAINPGNSGGALLNMNGEVIGINTAKLDIDAVEGMGYAIAISDAADTINSLMAMITKEKVDASEQGYLGIMGTSVTEEISSVYGMPQGVYIAEVNEGGAADEAGINMGTIITGFEGNAIYDMEGLQEMLTYYAVGESVEITVQVPSSDGSYTESTITVVLGAAS